MTDSILVIGDSISKGAIFDVVRDRPVLLRESFCNIVAPKLRYPVENISRYGSTSNDVYKSLLSRIKRRSAIPEITAISAGGNDCDFDWEAIAENPAYDHQPKIRLPDYEENLNKIISTVREVGSIPVLFNLPPVDADRYFQLITGGSQEKGSRVLEWLGQIGRIYWWHERYNAAVERVAQLTKTPIILIRNAMLSLDDYRILIGPDGLHPNRQGHRQIADTVLEFISIMRPALLV